MAKAPADTVKYNIYANVRIDGVVEKADVVGALFGQSEGLLGEDLELRDLQKTGRVGRIEVDIKPRNGKSTGKIVIPSSLDMVETSIIAATIESVDRVGPCNADINVFKVEDARNMKRKKLVTRAKEILKGLLNEELPESIELTEEVRKAVQLSEITSFKGLPAGPGVESSESVIIVEGRADVLNLLKCGIKNAIGVEGTNIPPAVKDLSKSKTTIAFVDGDRGGMMILNELDQVGDVDFVAQAPKGKEVEELGKKEIIMALRRKMPLDQFKAAASGQNGGNGGRNKGSSHKSSRNNRRDQSRGRGSSTSQTRSSGQDKELLSELSNVRGKLVAKLYSDSREEVSEVEIKDLIDSLADVQPAFIVLDGIVTQRLVDAAEANGVKTVVGVNTAAKLDKKGVRIITAGRR